MLAITPFSLPSLTSNLLQCGSAPIPADTVFQRKRQCLPWDIRQNTSVISPPA